MPWLFERIEWAGSEIRSEDRGQGAIRQEQKPDRYDQQEYGYREQRLPSTIPSAIGVQKGFLRPAVGQFFRAETAPAAARPDQIRATIAAFGIGLMLEQDDGCAAMKAETT